MEKILSHLIGRPKLFIAKISILLALPLSSHAIMLDLSVEDMLTNYNVVSLGDYTTRSHTEGRFIVFGSTYGDVSGAPNTLTVTPPDESVIVAGSVNGNMTINSGNVRISTNGVNSGVTLSNSASMAKFENGNTIQLNGGGKIILDSTMDISSSALAIKHFSVDVGRLSNDADASINVINGDLVGSLVDSNADGLVIVELAYSELATISNNNSTSAFLTQLATVDGVVVNVTGTPTGTLKNDGWNDTFASKMLFNFVDATIEDTITISGSGKFWGNMLAPDSNIDSTGNVIEGTVIANNLDHGGQQIHLPTMDSEFASKLVSAVPEPATYALIFGLSTLAIATAKRRRSAR
jgi:choice-of-anchor A domain-containing protein